MNGVGRDVLRAVDALPTEPFDIVVANILANPLRCWRPALAARTAPGGRIALSGILVAQADDVIDRVCALVRHATSRRTRTIGCCSQAGASRAR